MSQEADQEHSESHVLDPLEVEEDDWTEYWER